VQGQAVAGVGRDAVADQLRASRVPLRTACGSSWSKRLSAPSALRADAELGHDPEARALIGEKQIGIRLVSTYGGEGASGTAKPAG
jgi:hypothetical protein